VIYQSKHPGQASWPVPPPEPVLTVKAEVVVVVGVVVVEVLGTGTGAAETLWVDQRAELMMTFARATGAIEKDGMVAADTVEALKKRQSKVKRRVRVDANMVSVVRVAWIARGDY